MQLTISVVKSLTSCQLTELGELQPPVLKLGWKKNEQFKFQI